MPTVCLFSGMSHVSVEADAGQTQADDPRVDNEPTLSDNEETFNFDEETLTDNEDNVNEEALTYNEEGQIGNHDALTDAGGVEKEFEDVQIHDEDDNQIHNEEAQKNEGEDAVKGIVDTPKAEGRTQMDSEESEAERKVTHLLSNPLINKRVITNQWVVHGSCCFYLTIL